MIGRIIKKAFPTKMELTTPNIKKTEMHSLNSMAMDGGGMMVKDGLCNGNLQWNIIEEKEKQGGKDELQG